MKKILIIGNGSQSKRIQNILKKMNYKFSIFYYKIKKNSYISSALKSDIIFVCSPNRTHYHYINKGLSLSSGELIGIVNSDDLLTKNSLKILHKYYQTYPLCDFFFGTVKKHWLQIKCVSIL